MKPVKRYRNGNLILDIYNDENPGNPREYSDNFGVIVYKHRQYNLGDVEIKGDVCEFLMELMEFKETRVEWWYRRYGSPGNELLQALLAEFSKHHIWMPIFLYDHGGISLSTTSFIGKAHHAEWDSGMCGFIYVTSKKAKEEFPNDLDYASKALNLLNEEFETFKEYAEGEVYGFILYEEQKCDLGHRHLVEKDACWGFYGYDHQKSGLIDTACSENDLKFEDFVEERV